jgi:hypothetical protein
MNTISSVNLLEICKTQYRTVASKSVYAETLLGFPREKVDEVFREMPVEDCSDNKDYSNIISYLRNRYPYLGEGELSTALLAFIKYDLKGMQSYIVTDDLRFKKRLPEILTALPLTKILGSNVPGIRVTGTIGLIRQLYRRERISPETMLSIITDLRKGTLFITDKLIDELRECLE